MAIHTTKPAVGRVLLFVRRPPSNDGGSYRNALCALSVYGFEDRFGRCGPMDIGVAFGVGTAGADGVFHGLDEGNGEYEGGFSDGLGSVDGGGSGIGEEADPEVFGIGDRANRRDLVGRRRMGTEVALLIPDEFFAREPAVTLGESAFDLAAIDTRDNGIADVVNGFDIDEAIFARERADFDFENADAVGVVGKRHAAPFFCIVADPRRRVVAGSRQLDASGIRPPQNLLHRDRFAIGNEAKIVVENDISFCFFVE